MKKNSLLVSLFLFATAGFLMHFKVHNFMVVDRLHPWVHSFNISLLPAMLLPMLDVIVVTALFMFRSTAVYGYLLNGLLVIYGTVLMIHYSLAQMAAGVLPVQALLLKSTLPDICIAWGDFFIGKALYDSYTRDTALSQQIARAAEPVL